MGLSELRQELLQQHAALRALAERAADVAQRARGDGAALLELRGLLAQLGEDVARHNAFEERELHEILLNLDAWGPHRDQLMDLRHAAEHAAIVRAIRNASSSRTAGAVAVRTRAVLRRLATHIDREEREFLHPDVLDGNGITDGVGG